MKPRRVSYRRPSRRSHGLGEAAPPPPRRAPLVRLMTPKQLADFLQISPRTVARQIQQGRIPYIRVSANQVRFNPAEVIESLRKKPGA